MSAADLMAATLAGARAMHDAQFANVRAPRREAQMQHSSDAVSRAAGVSESAGSG